MLNFSLSLVLIISICNIMMLIIRFKPEKVQEEQYVDEAEEHKISILNMDYEQWR